MAEGYTVNQSFDSDDEDNTHFQSSGRDACIIVIDCSSSMFTEFERDEKTLSSFTICLNVFERLMLNKIINNNKDLIGAILYNTKNSPDPGDNMHNDNSLVVPKNCAVLMPLNQIEPENIRFIKNLLASDDFLDFDNKFGHSTDAKIADVLWLCSSIFSSCGKQIKVPQIMWFTDQDSPHQVGSSDHQQSFQRAKDLQQFQLDLQFYPMKDSFDGGLFYKELLCQILGIEMEEFEFPTTQLDEKLLIQRMFRRAHNKRAIAHLLVEISSNAKFGVGIYSLTRTSQIPKSTVISRHSRELIETKRSYKYGVIPEDAVDVDNLHYDLDYTEKLEPGMMVKYQQCGGEKIKFTHLEAYEIKQVMDPKIKILGFKPSSVLSDYHHIKGSYFIYPNDNKIKHSATLFRALWERCLVDDKVIICIFTMRLKSYPRLVALVPQEQKVGIDSEVLRYEGFRLDFIPFAGDIRDLSEVLTGKNLIDSNTTTVMKKMLSRLRLHYAPTMFNNPTVTNIYRKIEESYFEDENKTEDDIFEDPMVPNLDAQDNRIEEHIQCLSEQLGRLEDEDVKAAKRKNTDIIEGGPRKKITADDINIELVLEKCKEGRVKELTVSILKSYLELKGVSGLSKLTKSQLIENVLKLSKS
ncbi:CLUMA_CG015150, isoform A [Clunio marinus]|uniref:ATP-dependent DNA helicase 2 subunit 1 n=1 Tax=Clunio marinus TaxID=568069 RepID=A0A1J1IT29_9DIPT|nr:CLUMA_CG015150, isoform A [Clunio marinus]